MQDCKVLTTKILHMKTKQVKHLSFNAIRGNIWNNRFGQQGTKELPGYCSNKLCLYVNIKTDLTPIVKEFEVSWLSLANSLLVLVIHAMCFIETQYQDIWRDQKVREISLHIFKCPVCQMCSFKAMRVMQRRSRGTT